MGMSGKVHPRGTLRAVEGCVANSAPTDPLMPEDPDTLFPSLHAMDIARDPQGSHRRVPHETHPDDSTGQQTGGRSNLRFSSTAI
jgi:hypothetical protein